MDKIIAPQSEGKQLDANLKAILDVLDNAPNHNGKVLYIHHGKIAFEDGEKLFAIIPL